MAEYTYIRKKVEALEFKVGDFVRTEYETIGVITEIIAHDFVVVRTNNFLYFNLSKSRLEHIKAHLEPFDLEDKDTRKNLLGIWIKHYRLNDGLTERQIVGFDVNSEQYLILGDARIEPEVALSHEWTFMDGSPCGLVVEDEQ